MQKIDAIIRVAFNVDPEELSDEQWTKRFQEWVYVNAIQRKAQEAMLERTFKKSLVEVVNMVFEALNKKKPGGK